MAQLRQVGANDFQNAPAGEVSVNQERLATSLLAAHLVPTIHRTHFRPLGSEQLARTECELNRFLAF